MLGILTTMIPHLWQYIRYWCSEAGFSLIHYDNSYIDNDSRYVFLTASLIRHFPWFLPNFQPDTGMWYVACGMWSATQINHPRIAFQVTRAWTNWSQTFCQKSCRFAIAHLHDIASLAKPPWLRWQETKTPTWEKIITQLRLDSFNHLQSSHSCFYLRKVFWTFECHS